MQIYFDIRSRSQSRLLIRECQSVDHVMILGVLQPVQEANHALVIATDGGIQRNFRYSVRGKVLGMKRERSDLQTGLLAQVLKFSGNYGISRANWRQRILEKSAIRFRFWDGLLDIAGALHVG